MRKQVVGLEDKANVEVTELRQFISGHHGQILAVDDDGSLVRLIQRSQQIEEGALARSTGTHNGHALLGSHAEVDLIQDPDLVITRPERFGNPSNLHQGHAHGDNLSNPQPLSGFRFNPLNPRGETPARPNRQCEQVSLQTV